MRRAVLTLLSTSALLGAGVGCSHASILDRSAPTTSVPGPTAEERSNEAPPVVPSPFAPAPFDAPGAARPLGLAHCNPPPRSSWRGPTGCVDELLPVWPPSVAGE